MTAFCERKGLPGSGNDDGDPQGLLERALRPDRRAAGVGQLHGVRAGHGAGRVPPARRPRCLAGRPPESAPAKRSGRAAGRWSAPTGRARTARYAAAGDRSRCACPDGEGASPAPVSRGGFDPARGDSVPPRYTCTAWPGMHAVLLPVAGLGDEQGGAARPGRPPGTPGPGGGTARGSSRPGIGHGPVINGIRDTRHRAARRGARGPRSGGTSAARPRLARRGAARRGTARRGTASRGAAGPRAADGRAARSAAGQQGPGQQDSQQDGGRRSRPPGGPQRAANPHAAIVARRTSHDTPFRTTSHELDVPASPPGSVPLGGMTTAAGVPRSGAG